MPKSALSEQSESKGFTLVELLVVISIIAILSVVGITIFTSAQNATRISSTKEELRRLQQAMMAYRVANRELPPRGDSCPACQNDNSARADDLRRGLLTALTSSNEGGPYISNAEDFVYDAWGEAYYYDDNDANIGIAGKPCQCYSEGPHCYVSTSSLFSSGPDKNRGGTDNISFHIPCP